MLMELQINDPVIVNARELATHAAEIKHLQDDMDKLVSDMEEVKEALADIRKMLAEDQASKKTIHYVFNILSVLLGGGIVFILQKVWK
jgi:prefoldin subunit 5